MILVMLINIIDSTSISQICTFYKCRAHVVENYLYISSRVLIFLIELIFDTTQPAISINSQIPMT